MQRRAENSISVSLPTERNMILLTIFFWLQSKWNSLWFLIKRTWLISVLDFRLSSNWKEYDCINNFLLIINLMKFYLAHNLLSILLKKYIVKNLAYYPLLSSSLYFRISMIFENTYNVVGLCCNDKMALLSQIDFV